jgi:hypothetical protein
MRRLVVALDASMSLETEFLARRRTLRALDTTEALDQGISCFVARESFELGGDEEPVVADRTRVAADHWLVHEYPDRFETALAFPIGAPSRPTSEAEDEPNARPTPEERFARGGAPDGPGPEVTGDDA